MSDSAISRIGTDIVEELKDAIDAWANDPNNGKAKGHLKQVLWDNKIGLLRCAQKVATRS